MTPLAALYKIVVNHRNRAWDRQVSVVPGHPDWEPENADEGPVGDVARFWYETGQAQAYANVMTEIETMRAEVGS